MIWRANSLLMVQGVTKAKAAAMQSALAPPLGAVPAMTGISNPGIQWIVIVEHPSRYLLRAGGWLGRSPLGVSSASSGPRLEPSSWGISVVRAGGRASTTGVGSSSLVPRSEPSAQYGVEGCLLWMGRRLDRLRRDGRIRLGPVST